MKTFVVIPNWNGAALLEECLGSLAKQTAAHETIVVDNGSTDGSGELVRQKFGDVRLLEFGDNAGFAGGVNRGIREALKHGAEYIALLNNDAVADRRWLEFLLESMDYDAKIGAVTAKILTQDGKNLDSTGDFYSIWGLPFPRGRGETDTGQFDGALTREIFAASGGASLYRTAMFREIGLFDEEFFAYFEDIDIGFRGRLAGWQMLYEPRAKVRHYIGATSSRMGANGSQKSGPQSAAPDRPSAFARYHTVKNFGYLYLKNMPTWLFWKYLPWAMASWGLMVVSDARRGLLVTNLQANVAALRHLPVMLAARRAIQARRSVSSDDIDELLYHELPPLQRKRFEQLGWARPHR